MALNQPPSHSQDRFITFYGKTSLKEYPYPCPLPKEEKKKRRNSHSKFLPYHPNYGNLCQVTQKVQSSTIQYSEPLTK